MCLETDLDYLSYKRGDSAKGGVEIKLKPGGNLSWVWSSLLYAYTIGFICWMTSTAISK